jgi:hypothetical protein
MMCRISILWLGALIATACLCHAQGVKSGRKDFAARSTMADVLEKTPFSGSLEYSGDCDDKSQELPVLPAIRVPPGDRDSSALVILREIFADDHKMQVTQETGGTSRMVESGVPQGLLDVTIRKLCFNDIYDPISAEAMIISAPEVQAFMKAHGIERGSDRFRRAVPGFRQGPEPGLPHISGDLDNVTVEQALDHLLKTFPGLWVYQNCLSETGGRVVAFDYLRAF